MNARIQIVRTATMACSVPVTENANVVAAHATHSTKENLAPASQGQLTARKWVKISHAMVVASARAENAVVTIRTQANSATIVR